MNGSQLPGRSLLSRLLEAALTLAAIAWLLSWAWQLLRPLVPVILVMTGVVLVGSFVVGRRRGW